MTHLVTTLAVRDSRATLRVGDRSNGFAVIKASSVRDGFADEVRARSVLVDAGFPVAAPLSYVAGPPSILALPWVDGRPVDSTCPAASLQRVGELLARVHERPATGPSTGNATWSGWMAEWHSTEVVDPELRERFLGIARDGLSRLSGRWRPDRPR